VGEFDVGSGLDDGVERVVFGKLLVSERTEQSERLGQMNRVSAQRLRVRCCTISGSRSDRLIRLWATEFRHARNSLCAEYVIIEEIVS
jgi:hypothetical protein